MLLVQPSLPSFHFHLSPSGIAMISKHAIGTATSSKISYPFAPHTPPRNFPLRLLTDSNGTKMPEALSRPSSSPSTLSTSSRSWVSHRICIVVHCTPNSVTCQLMVSSACWQRPVLALSSPAGDCMRAAHIKCHCMSLYESCNTAAHSK